ncbi:MAG: peptide chain release factor N(5)-glutamine methyltransferase [Marinifilaceae bacterium]
MTEPATIKQLIQYIRKELQQYYPPREIEGIYFLLFEHILKYSKIEIHLNKEEGIHPDKIKKIKEAIVELKTHKPIQYILGCTEFYEMEFKVNEHTLIPRPETEELVHWILQENQEKAAQILDIGSGSGCIPISLAKNLPEAKVLSVDISEGALATAIENASLNEVNVAFEQRDILKWKDYEWEVPFDIIVSNPPYVRESEKQAMEPNVLKYEPDSALFVSDSDPLIFYRTIANFANIHLKKGGKLYFEINEYLGNEMVSLLEQTGYQNVQLKKDINGRDRMVCAIKH